MRLTRISKKGTHFYLNGEELGERAWDECLLDLSYAQLLRVEVDYISHDFTADFDLDVQQEWYNFGDPFQGLHFKELHNACPMSGV